MKRIFTMFAIAAMMMIAVSCRNNAAANAENEVAIDSTEIVIAPADSLAIDSLKAE